MRSLCPQGNPNAVRPDIAIRKSSEAYEMLFNSVLFVVCF